MLFKLQATVVASAVILLAPVGKAQVQGQQPSISQSEESSYVKVSQANGNGAATANDFPDFTKHFSHEDVLHDISEYERLLNREWILSNLGGADFGKAFANLRTRSAEGMSYGELLLEFQKILALGKDGHAEMNWLLPVLRSPGNVFPNFIIDICGDDYIAYKVVHLPEGPVNMRYKYRFELLRDGYPYLLAIDGVEIEKWVDAVSQYVAKGPELSVRWQALMKIHYLPFWRKELGLPQSQQIRVLLASRDRKTQVELNAPVGKHALAHYRIPKPDWKIVDGEVGYMWVRNPASGGAEVILQSMPEFKETKGLIIDLRGNHGGASIANLQLLAAFLLPPESPHRVVGRVVQWSGGEWDLMISQNNTGLSEAGRKAILQFDKRFPTKWKPPSDRPVEWRYVLLTRPEAEPGIRPFNDPEFPLDMFPVYHYERPVVVLFDQRCFSSGEFILAGLQHLDNVTLIGTETTSAAGTSAALFRLPKTAIEAGIGYGPALVLRSGVPLDGTGVRPDIVLPPDVDYFIGKHDRMISKAVQLLRDKSR